MKSVMLWLAFLSPVSFTGFADKVSSNDIKIITGETWKGKLTYLDYSSGQRTSILANLVVKQSETQKNTFYFFNDYPKEPHANSIDTVIISKDGKQINDQSVIKKETVGNIIKIITEKGGMKNEDQKLYRYTYLLGTNLFSIKKEEKGIRDTVFVTRNIYEYQRKPAM